MLSIVFHTDDDVRPAAQHFADHRRTVPLQFIRVRGPSRAAAYNHALDLAVYPALLFARPDAQLLSPDFLPHLLAHLQRTDLLGITGTLRVSGADWFRSAHPYLLGQYLYGLPDGRIAHVVFNVPAPFVPNAQALDGPLIACPLALAKSLRFDESFTGLNYAEMDFSFRAHLAGHRLAVACDLPVYLPTPPPHAPDWQSQAAHFDQKHQHRWQPLPERRFDLRLLSLPSLDAALPYLTPAYWTTT
jgi:hypothetical protein